MKKGQAAMEFLMTYGWAILVVLAAIGALAYFGVLSPDRFMPSKCLISGGFSCTEYKVTATGVQMNIQNNLGVDAVNVNVTLVGQAPNTCTATILNATLNNGATMGLGTYTCAVTGKFKGDIIIGYTKSGESVTHTTTGSISGGIEN